MAVLLSLSYRVLIIHIISFFSCRQKTVTCFQTVGAKYFSLKITVLPHSSLGFICSDRDLH